MVFDRRHASHSYFYRSRGGREFILFSSLYKDCRRTVRMLSTVACNTSIEAVAEQVKHVLDLGQQIAEVDRDVGSFA